MKIEIHDVGQKFDKNYKFGLNFWRNWWFWMDEKKMTFWTRYFLYP